MSYTTSWDLTHGLIIAAGAEGIGLGNLARQQGVSVIAVHDILFAPCLQ